MKIAAVVLVILNAALLLPAVAEYAWFLVVASLVTAMVLAGVSFNSGASKPAAKLAMAEAVKPVAVNAPDNQAQVEVVTLLGIFQEKGRFIDFLMEDITPFTDAEVGGVARAVHQGCREALKEHFRIEPISQVGEGGTITLPAGYRADEFRLVGKLSGEAPFTGKIVHKGWRTTSVKLPRVLKGDHIPAIAPAQIELQ